MSNISIDRIYNIIDLCKYAEVDGTKAEIKISPYNDNSRLIRIGINDGYTREHYEYIYDNGIEFDLKVMPLIVKRFLEKDQISSWVTADPDIDGYPDKELIVTESGNECLIQTFDKNFHENFKDTIESVSLEKEEIEFTKEEKACEKILKYLKAKYKPREHLDACNPSLRQELISIIENAYMLNKGKTLTDEQIYNFAFNIEKGISKEAFEAIVNDIRNENSVLINEIRDYLKNERTYENYLDEEPYISICTAGTFLVENGYFNIRYAFPQKTDLDNLTEETFKEILTGEYKSKYKFLSEEKDALIKAGNEKDAQTIDIFMSYLVKSTRSKVNRNKTKKEDIKFNEKIQEYKVDDALTMLDAVRLYKGGKLDTEKFEIIIEEEKNAYVVNLRLSNGLSRDNNIFKFTKNDKFKEEILPAIINEFTALDAITDSSSKDDNVLMKTYTGNELLVKNHLISNVSLTLKDKEDYLKLADRKEESLSPYDLKLKEELASKNEAIGEYQRKEDEFKTGGITEEELLKAKEKLINEDTPRVTVEKTNSTSSNNNNVINSPEDIDYGIIEKKGMLDGDSKYLASYFRKEILREKGLLPPTGLKEIEKLVSLSEDVRTLEEAREKMLRKELSKDKYDALHDYYRRMLSEAIKNKGNKAAVKASTERKTIVKTNDKFDYLHDLALKYKVQNVNGEIKVYNRSVNSEVMFRNDKQLEAVEFANFWNSALGLKSSRDDIVLGEKYAFSENSRKLFKIISNNLNGDYLKLDNIKEEFKNSGIDNQDIIFNRLFKNESYVNYVTKGMKRFNKTYAGTNLDVVEENPEIKEIVDAYEIAESYSDDKQNATLKLHIPKENDDKLEVFVSHGIEKDETVIYTKTYNKDYFLKELLQKVVDGFNKISGIVKINSYKVPDSDKELLIAMGNKDAVFQVTNMDSKDMDTVRKSLSNAEVTEEEKGKHGVK